MRRALPAIAALYFASCTCGTPPGAACDGDTKCSGGQLCLFGQCAPLCAEGRACPNELACSEGACRPPGACGDDMCLTGEVCVAGACYADACAGVLCPLGWVCDDGVCIDARCIGVICPTNTYCFEGVCIGPPGCADGGAAGGSGGAGGGAAGGATAGGATAGGGTAGGSTAGGGTAGGSTAGGSTAGGGTSGGSTAGGGTAGGAGPTWGDIEGVVVVWNRCDLQPVPGAVVTAAGAMNAVTDLNGRFRLSMVPIGTGVVVTVRVAPGSYLVEITHALVDVLPGATSHVMVRLFTTCSDVATLAPASSVALTGNTFCQPTPVAAGVTYGDLLWPDGGVYSGDLLLRYAAAQRVDLGDGGFDLSGLTALPGRGTGITATDAGVGLETLSAAWLELFDQVTSERLTVAPGHALTIEQTAIFAAPAAPQPSAWWFDPARGEWREQGPSSSLDGGAVFTHGMTRSGWWSVQRPLLATSCAEGFVSDGTNPIAGADVRLLGIDRGWFGAATTDNAGRFCVQAMPAIDVVSIGRRGDPAVGAALDGYALRRANTGTTGPVPCNPGGGCQPLGTLTVVPPQRGCVTGAIHDSPFPDGGLPPVSDDVYYSADVAILNDYRRSLCTSSRVRLSGVRSGPDGGFCVPALASGPVNLGNDRSPYNCRPMPDTQWDAGPGATCGGGACVDVGPQYWYCNS